MTWRKSALLLVVALVGALSLGGSDAAAGAPDLTGQWYGMGDSSTHPGVSVRVEMYVFEYPGYGLLAYLYVPDIGLLDDVVPVTLLGSTVMIGDPSVLAMIGTLDGDTIAGTTTVPAAFPPGYTTFDWTLWKDTGVTPHPGTASGEICDALPDLFVPGSASHVAELVQFDPVEGQGYIDQLNGETWDDQYRSWCRRDLRQLVDYATAKVACLSADWSYWDFEPLGLGDMSEEDGSIPGTSIGYPGHPVGSHTDGRDIDLGYYQRFASNNSLRAIGRHHDELGVDQGHLTAAPYALDVWRTALLLACLAEHPRLRLVGVDGQAGPLLEDALDDLVTLGWIDGGLRDRIPLIYETVDLGWGFYYFHHHHLHVSLRPVEDILDSLELTPDSKRGKGWGHDVHALIELDEGYDVEDIDPTDVALMLDGKTLLHARSRGAKVGDHDKDGIPDLRVGFDRREVWKAVGTGTFELTVTGRVNSHFFQGADTVTIAVPAQGNGRKSR